MLFEFIKNHPSALLAVTVTSLIVIVRLISLIKEMNDLQIPVKAEKQWPRPAENNEYKQKYSDAA
jgi:hypothetical protein